MNLQDSLVARLREVALSLKEGKYGQEDDIDFEALRDDIDEIMEEAEFSKEE